MSRSITARFEMDGIFHSSPSNGKHRVARLMSALEDLETLSAKSEHLGHERQAIQPSLLVQSSENLLFGPNLD